MFFLGALPLLSPSSSPPWLCPSTTDPLVQGVEEMARRGRGSEDDAEYGAGAECAEVAPATVGVETEGRIHVHGYTFSSFSSRSFLEVNSLRVGLWPSDVRTGKVAHGVVPSFPTPPFSCGAVGWTPLGGTPAWSKGVARIVASESPIRLSSSPSPLLLVEVPTGEAEEAVFVWREEEEATHGGDFSTDVVAVGRLGCACRTMHGIISAASRRYATCWDTSR